MAAAASTGLNPARMYCQNRFSLHRNMASTSLV
jgi:hypothetical protein